MAKSWRGNINSLSGILGTVDLERLKKSIAPLKTKSFPIWISLHAICIGSRDIGNLKMLLDKRTPDKMCSVMK